MNYVKLHPDAITPTQATPGAAAYDLYACEEAAIHGYQSRTLIDTGIALALPPNCVALVCSRSGLATKHGVFVLNSPGVIDSDYRGSIKVILSRLPLDTAWPSIEPSFLIHPGDRIAQLLILPIWHFNFHEVATLDPTVRATGGFGSTGTGTIVDSRQKELQLAH